MASLIATILDPAGRRVILTETRWRHILDGHPELGAYLDDVLQVVAYEHEEGRIITAFRRRSVP